MDSCAGPVSYGANVDTAAVGQKTFRAEAADLAGNVVSGSNTYRVVYGFAGFFGPVDNPDVLNQAQAGSAIPVKFSLGGDQGLDIFTRGPRRIQLPQERRDGPRLQGPRRCS